MTVLNMDCIEGMRLFPDAYFDSIVTDPPYELGFMGKSWDASGIAYSVEMWTEALRVLKPGGHLLAFSGSRTYHRMVCAIEDAGFEIRDQILWIYGSGFPKSLDVSKAIDKARDDSADIEHVRVWLEARRVASGLTRKEVNERLGLASNGGGSMSSWTTNGTTRAVPQWEQWQALKGMLGFGNEMDAEVWRLNGRKGTPGNEREDREVSAPASNDVFQPTQRVINAGTPVLDAARQWQGWGTALKPAHEPIVVARKPLISTVAANVLQFGTGAINVDGCRIATTENLNGGAYAEVGGRQVSGSLHAGSGMNVAGKTVGADFVQPAGRWPANLIHDGSDEVLAAFPQGAGRFYYAAKTSKADRGADNVHPTVKPTDLMRYLCRLVTPPGGTVLDPFTGSGSTGKAARLEGFGFIGFELSEEYTRIATARIAGVTAP